MPRFHSVATGFLTAALILACSSSQAQDTPTCRAGLKSFTLPSPAPELREMGPDLRVLMEPLAPAKLRLIAAFMLPDNLNQLPGTTAPLTKYALVEVPRAAEFQDVDETIFKTVVDGMSQQFSSGNLQSTMQTEIDRHLAELAQHAVFLRIAGRGAELLGAAAGQVRPGAGTRYRSGEAAAGFADLGAGKLTVDKPTQLGTLFSKPNASGFAMLMPMALNDKTVTLVAATLAVRVRNRVLFGYLYTQYKDKTSVDWITKTSEAWVDAILKSNER